MVRLCYATVHIGSQKIDMLEKPNLPDSKLIACLRENYVINVAEITFLPLGADMDTAVYRAVASDGTPYFVKLRSGHFDEVTVLVPRLLVEQGMKQVIAPLSTQSGELWATLDDYKVMVSPFVEGHNGFDKPLSDSLWVEFGRALKGLHTAKIPKGIMERIPRETFSPQWRELVRDFQARAERETFNEPFAAGLATLLRSKRDVVSDLIRRAEKLAEVMKTQSLDTIVCHADIHVWNLLITADNRLYIVDWDTLIRAPKERDLMFIGAGMGGRADGQEAELFYDGYGQTHVDPAALAYYRFERIVQDISAYCEQLLLTDEGGDDRAEGLRQITGQFAAGDVIDMAYRSVKDLPPELQ